MQPDAANKSIQAPRGTTISCKGWIQEAAMRMLMNNLDPDVGEKPEEPGLTEEEIEIVEGASKVTAGM